MTSTSVSLGAATTLDQRLSFMDEAFKPASEVHEEQKQKRGMIARLLGAAKPKAAAAQAVIAANKNVYDKKAAN
eukprot:CAMPEP_0181325218 /NCGR_PEP_ID=MMETSP1101-20121128/20801_1 /TAXON_ID=46948 /ORGANISM="Rhodomonas abbreviata, Strain Caron Lab Isolate" /LENGTH=73 /DNA_ID=CAMNT_0023433497 /DNA_START=37 /DNA_END=258 /DNA_ORIENTATION=+